MIASTSRLSRLLNTNQDSAHSDPSFFQSFCHSFWPTKLISTPSTLFACRRRAQVHKHPGGHAQKKVKFRRIAFRPSGASTLVLVSCRPLVHLIIIGGTGRLITALLDGCTMARQQSIMTRAPHFSSFRHRRTVPH
jgi:hypothetical protein